MLHERCERLAGGLAGPEFRAVVQVEADGQPVPPGHRARLGNDAGRGGGERGCDAGPVQPSRAVEDARPVEIAGLRVREGAAGAVVDDLARALARALFEKINADPLAAARDVRDVHAEPAQLVDRPLREVVFGKPGHERRAGAELREHHRDIRLGAAKGNLKVRRLRQPQPAWRGEAQHDFSKGDDIGHGPRSMRERRGHWKAQCAEKLPV